MWAYLPFYPALYNKRPFPLHPLGLVLSVTHRCNFACATCHVTDRVGEGKELTLEEIRLIFSHLPDNLLWITLTGGEPFLRTDLLEITREALRLSRPRFLNLPTNGHFTQRVADFADGLNTPGLGALTRIILSVDGLYEEHDRLRASPGSFEKLLETYRHIRLMAHPKIQVGFNLTISRFNVGSILPVYEYLYQLSPDFIVFEVAGGRKELNVSAAEVTPDPQALADFENRFKKFLQNKRFFGVNRFFHQFKIEYLSRAVDTLSHQRRNHRCYAGFASVYVGATGEVWDCPVAGRRMGYLREVDYDLMACFRSAEAEITRELIRKKVCFCALSNAEYWNMALSPAVAARVAVKSLGR